MSAAYNSTNQTSRNSHNHVASVSAFSALIVVCALWVGCGKKGPPLPPLVKLPVAPADFTGERRGDRVDLQFTVPASNTDNSHPANIQRVDVYAITESGAITDADVLKYGSRVGSVEVKAPRDPNDTAEADETGAEVEEPTGNGLDQGAHARVQEEISPEALVPVPVKRGERKTKDGDAGPLLGPAISAPSRSYVAVGVSTRGRRGATSRRVAVPLIPLPATPSAPTITYSEKAVSLAWSAPEAAAASDVLPSRPLGSAQPSFGFNVYETRTTGGTAPADGVAAATSPAPKRLTNAPLTTPAFTDERVTFGVERCYAVRVIETLGNATIESDPSPEACVTLVDTFPPAAPKQLTAVASEGAISLIWDPNTESDLAGYLVLRGPTADALQPITPAPVAETTFKDTVAAGSHYVYAVQAVDKAGNRSAPSNTVEETAR